MSAIPNLDGIRAVVDARIKALAERRAKRRAERRAKRPPSIPPAASCEAPPDVSLDMCGESASDVSLSRDRRESSPDARQRPRPLGHVAASYGRGRFDCMMECRRPIRLADGLVVPSVEPRPPNLNAVNLSFAARLMIAVRDKFNGDAPKVYTAANVSRQVYSQIVSDETRPVSKRTAVRFAFALKSTPEEARLLLKSAGFAFSNSQTEDFILQACLENNPPVWDLGAVNKLLKEYRVDFQY